jgi:hypothetical protein
VSTVPEDLPALVLRLVNFFLKKDKEKLHEFLPFFYFLEHELILFGFVDFV